MNAFILKRIDDTGTLEKAELPLPVIQATDVLVKVHAIDINPVDNKTLQGKGRYELIKEDHPVILGWGISGEIVETGSDVTDFQQGDAVFGLIRFPGHARAYAEYVAAPADQLAPKPAAVSHESAAATTLAALTAYQALAKAQLKAGERVFVQGAAGGVGFFAVQLAKQAGAYVIGTARTRDEALLKANGLDELIDFQTTDFEKATDRIDLVLDTLGSENAVKALAILQPNGRLITLPSGGTTDWKDVARQKGIQADHVMVHSSGDDMRVLAGLLANGALQPNIVHRFTFDDLPHIQELMSAKQISGKIVVSV